MRVFLVVFWCIIKVCYDIWDDRDLMLLQQSQNLKNKSYYNSPSVGKIGC
jgi:hypothetical protein